MGEIKIGRPEQDPFTSGFFFATYWYINLVTDECFQVNMFNLGIAIKKYNEVSSGD